MYTAALVAEIRGDHICRAQTWVRDSSWKSKAKSLRRAQVVE